MNTASEEFLNLLLEHMFFYITLWGHPHVGASPHYSALSHTPSVFSLAIQPFSGPQLSRVIKQATPAVKPATQVIQWQSKPTS